MATKIDLDALILRADFNETETNPALLRGGKLKASIDIRDLQRGEFFFSALRKPDFQRETNEWDAGKIIDLIKSFISGDVIPAVILWRADTGLIYVIDGSHRLSALAAWVNDDYGDGNISKTMNDDVISQEQIDTGNEVRIAVNKTVGSYADHKLAITHPNNVPPHVLAQSTALALQALPMQIVDGNSVKAEDSFRKINEQGVSLDATEKKILDSRDKPRGISARAMVRGGKGYKYWAAFEPDVKNKVEQLARDIYELLYLPKLNNPIKTTDVPVAGKASAPYALTLTWDFINIVNPPSENEQIDKTGEVTLNFLGNCRYALRQVLSVEAVSLGLHPLVYMYSPHGKPKPASFYAIVDFVIKLSKMPKGFETFCRIREQFETLLIGNDAAIQQIVRQSRGAFASYQNITKFYIECMSRLAIGKSVQGTIEDLFKTPEFSFLSKPLAEPNYTASRSFSAETKSFAYIKDALPHIRKCPFCRGYLHCNAMTTDHKEEKSLGGDNSPKNAQPCHPWCNNTFKNILAAENRHS